MFEVSWGPVQGTRRESGPRRLWSFAPALARWGTSKRTAWGSGLALCRSHPSQCAPLCPACSCPHRSHTGSAVLKSMSKRWMRRTGQPVHYDAIRAPVAWRGGLSKSSRHCVERYLGLSPHISGTGTACSTRAFLFFTLRRVAWLWVAKNQQHTEIDQGHPSHLHICILPPSAPLFSADVGPAQWGQAASPIKHCHKSSVQCIGQPHAVRTCACHRITVSAVTTHQHSKPARDNQSHRNRPLHVFMMHQSEEMRRQSDVNSCIHRQASPGAPPPPCVQGLAH